MNRSLIKPILTAIPAVRQKDARHYGVHPYFTRRPPNVVRAYLERYSQEMDVVFDPFGGTGVTAIEAFLLGRHAIHNDLNPLANFIARNIADTSLTSTHELRETFERVEQTCATTLQGIEIDEKKAIKLLERLPLPENIKLPRNSDAEYYFDLFTPRQLAGLALLKQTIDNEENESIREALLLAWSASLAKLNKTFLSAKGRAESRGGSSIFSIYRYKLAAKCVELPIWETFRGRFVNVLAAKEEIIRCRKYWEQHSHASRTLDSKRDFQVLAHDAAELAEVLEPESIDYIFTDPPYGAFISYLDLSILWNHWLGFHVSTSAHEQETIVGGEQNHSEEHYQQSLARSIRTCFDLLRPDRWCSIVFQHWELSYFATILETASECGAELKAAITQTGDVIWSMHKKKNSVGVLAGELILTFYKSTKRSGEQTVRTQDENKNPEDVLTEILDACLANEITSISSEELFNRLVIELWRRSALRCLALDRREFARYLEQRGWNYDPQTHRWSTNAAVQAGTMNLF